MRCRDPVEPGHIARVSKVVAGRDRHGARGDRRGHCLRRDVRRGGIDIDEHRPEPVPDDRSRARQKSEARDDHFARRFARGGGWGDAIPRRRLHHRDRAGAAGPNGLATPGSQIEAPVHQHQADRAAADGDGMTNAEVIGDRRLETLQVRPLGQPSRCQDGVIVRSQSLQRRQGGADEGNADGIRRLGRARLDLLAHQEATLMGSAGLKWVRSSWPAPPPGAPTRDRADRRRRSRRDA